MFGKKEIARDWATLETIVSRLDVQANELLEKALRSQIEQERGHRRFCSFGPGMRAYALSVEYAARYCILQKLSEEAPKVPKTWREFSEWPDFVAKVWALREAVYKHLPAHMKAKHPTYAEVAIKREYQ